MGHLRHHRAHGTHHCLPSAPPQPATELDLAIRPPVTLCLRLTAMVHTDRGRIAGYLLAESLSFLLMTSKDDFGAAGLRTSRHAPATRHELEGEHIGATLAQWLSPALPGASWGK